MSFVTHLVLQKKQIIKVTLYSMEAFAICLVGTWLFSSGTTVATKLLISGVFALLVFGVGLCGVMLVSMSVAGKNRTDEKTKNE